MVDRVAMAMRKMAANVTRKHAKSFDIAAYRKTISRENPKELGGARVLSSDDEPDYEYNELGDGTLVFLDNYNPSSLTDNSSTFDYAEPHFFGLVESLAKEDEEGYFRLIKSDIVYIIFDENTAIALEVAGVESTVGVSPYGARYKLEKRDDMDHSITFLSN